MVDESISATRTIDGSAEVIFGVLANPAMHPAIDGTGRVVASLDSTPLIAVAQIFRMTMFHPGHPNGRYEIANRVEVLERPSVIGWMPGYDSDDGALEFGGWIWRYDLRPAEYETTVVTLSYDWSAVSESVRKRMTLPPFPLEHLSNSLANLADLAAQ